MCHSIPKHPPSLFECVGEALGAGCNLVQCLNRGRKLRLQARPDFFRLLPVIAGPATALERRHCLRRLLEGILDGAASLPHRGDGGA